MVSFLFRNRILYKNFLFYHQKKSSVSRISCESVNYHFLRLCNYSCKFCFHTKKTSFILPFAEAKKGLKLLKEAGMKKINFSGGEPFLEAELLGNMVKYCKEELYLESVSIVSNGSKIKEQFFKMYGNYVDILAISCDSFDEETLKNIGRGVGKAHLNQLKKIRDWCLNYNVQFKINTVVCSLNHSEDMNKQIKELNPIRWKVFQCLLIDGENINISEESLRNAKDMVVSNKIFDEFIKRHDANKPIPENNFLMQNSYLLLDEYMRFLNCSNGKKEPSLSILDVGVKDALNDSGFDENTYLARGGRFDWSKKKRNQTFGSKLEF